MNDKIYTDEPDNPFLNIQPIDRRMLLRILYPTIDYDLIFYPENDNKELLDEFGIPTRVISGRLPYIICVGEPELKEHLIQEAKKWYKEKHKL